MNSESDYQNIREDVWQGSSFAGLRSDASLPTRLAAENLRALNYTTAHSPLTRGGCSLVVAVQLKELGSHQLWLSGYVEPSNSKARGGVAICNLDGADSAYLVSSIDANKSYASSAVNSYCNSPNSTKVELQCHYSEIDPVIEGLIQLALVALDKHGAISHDFAEHLAAVLHAHVLCRHVSAPGTPTPAGRLAHWQECRAKQMMCTQLEGDVCIESIAKACNLSPTHFSRAFAATVGTPPHRWLVQRRTYRACDLLRLTNLSISEVSSLCGFADQSHFTRVFKKIIGTSPGVWRRKATAP